MCMHCHKDVNPNSLLCVDIATKMLTLTTGMCRYCNKDVSTNLLDPNLYPELQAIVKFVTHIKVNCETCMLSTSEVFI